MSADQQRLLGEGGAIQLRAARVGDEERLAVLESSIFDGDDPWSAASFRSELSRPGTFYVVAELAASHELSGRLVVPPLAGYFGLAVLGVAGDYEVEVHTVGVDPALQGRGLGNAMMEEMVAFARRLDAPMFLEVRTDNEPAIGLYRKWGFEITGLRRNYYQQSGADAFTMTLVRENFSNG